MSIIKGAVQNLVFYMILVTVILNLVKASSYKKYVEMFTGLVLILILFTPIARLFSAEESLEKYLEANQFAFSFRDSAEFIYEAEDNTMEELIRLYKEKVKERVEHLGEQNEVTVERVETVFSSAEEGFGAIEKMEVRILEKEKRKDFKEVLEDAFLVPEGIVTVK